MASTSDTDETPAWIKGDLPAEPEEATIVPPGDSGGLESEAGAGEPGAEPAPEIASEAEPVVEPAPVLNSAPAPESALAAALEASPALDAPEALPEPPGAGAPAAASEPPPPEAERAEAARGPEMAVVAEPLSLEAQIESLLFVADGAVTVARLAEALEVPNREVEAALAALEQSYAQRGLSLQRFRDKVQLTTSPSAAGRVERFLGLAAATPLSRAALETLAIVAYQQPVTRPQIEAVRGVNSDSVIKNLLSKGLIEESGRAEGPGRPVLYTTTSEFMQHFGIASLGDLPPLSLPTATAAASHEQILKG